MKNRTVDFGCKLHFPKIHLNHLMELLSIQVKFQKHSLLLRPNEL